MRRGSSSMQIEANTLVNPKTSTFGQFGREAIAQIDQSGVSDDPPPPIPTGRESLAVSPVADLLRQAMAELELHLYLERAANVLLDEQPAERFGPTPWSVVWLAPATAEVQESSAVTREKARLLNELHAAFEADPLEDGMDHPAERVIGEALHHAENEHVLDWLRAVSLDTAQPSFAASVLRCLGRIEHVGPPSWCAQLVRNGLELDDVEIRDAAAQAAESWGDPGIVDILTAHDEPELWLREYIQEVAVDLRD